MIREMGFPYAEMEREGIMLPVYSVEAKYRSVLKYDELITIETTLKELPAARITFYQNIYNEAGELVHEAKVILVFQDSKTNRVVKAPEKLMKILEKF